MSHSAVAVSVGGAAMPESATAAGASDLNVSASTKQPPPEALQDGDTSNSLEPGEVVTPPHHRLSVSPALKKQMPLGKTLRKTLNSHNHIKDADSCEEQVRALYELSRKENGAQEAPMDDADDSEGLYSDTDSSVEDLKSVEDVQQARKEKQAEAAAAAALPQAPPTPFLGLSPLRFHMRAPPSCFDFPRMGYMPRMARGGPRGMRPPFFGRPPPPNRMGSLAMLGGQSPVLPGAAQLPPSGAGSQGSVGNHPGRSKRPQSDLSWTTLQPAVSFTFNLIPECSSTKHRDCKQKAESATTQKSKEPPASDEKVKNATEQSDPLREMSKEESQQNISARGKTLDRPKEKDQNRGRTRERSQARNSIRGSPERAREKSKDRDLTRGRTRERSKEKEFNRGRSRGSSQPRKSRGKSRERDPSKGRTRDRSRARDQVRGKTREKSRDRERTKTVTEKQRHLDQTREKDRNMSQERNQKGGTTRERSRERDRTRARTTDRSRSKKKLDRKEQHIARSKETANEPLHEMPKDKPTEIPDKFGKIGDKSRDKRHERFRENHSEKTKENARERSRRSSKERIHEKSAERVHQMEIQEQKNRFRDRDEDTIEPPTDKLPQKFAERRRERSGDKLRERSRDRYSKEKSQEQSREKPRHSKHDKSRDHSRERQLDSHKESRSRRAATPHDSFGDSSKTHSKSMASSAWAGKEGTPPMTPPQQRAQTPPASDTPKTKVFDIFADSPPRPNTAVAAVSAVIIERSTTPPLKAAPVAARTPKLTPLLKASEIHSRIGALLQDDDNDLHLEALLANKEQLMRRTNEHKERKEAPKEIKAEKEVEPRRYVNPFNRESVLSSERKSYSFQRNGSRRNNDSESEENWDKDEERQNETLPSRRGEFKDISIKIEKDLTPPPPQRTFTVTRIKVERNATPPRVTSDRDRDREVLVRNGAVAANAPPPPANEQESPDTDDYIDNWENDDSISSMPKNAAPATPTAPAPAPTAPAAGPKPNAPINITPLPPPPLDFNDDSDEDEDDSNALWNANSTPPPRSKTANPPMSNIHELYDKFMNSIDMGSAEMEEDVSKNSSLSNSTAEDSSSGSDTSSTSSSSSDSDDDSSSEEEEEEDGNKTTSGDESISAAGASKSNQEDQPGKEHQQKKNNVSKDLRKLKSLEDNLARIQMMRENYDAGDEISEELLKMESLFLMQRNAIMDKYRKQELKTNSSEDQQQQQQQMEAPPVETSAEQGSPAPVNSIFDANRGAIKMTISRLKLTSKSAIFDKDETDQHPAATKLSVEPSKPMLTLPLPPLKPPKEVAIVKPTIVEARSKPRVLRSPPPPSGSGNRRRSRSRSISRNKSKRRSLRPKSRSPSPKRWRPPSPRRGSRFNKRNSGGSAPGAATKIGRSHSRSLTRSRTRSRSPNRRRRPPSSAGSRRRGSLSPGPTKVAGPRSPPHPRLRRSLTRERERDRDRDRDRRSRSPLPFKPPSPPMRRSWSRSRSPTRRRSHSRSRSPRFRSPRDGSQSFADYFGENQNMEAAAYYYNMSLMQQEYQDPTGTGYDTYAAYMDSAYNMEQAYAQFTEGYAQMYGDYPGEMDSSGSPQLLGSSVLRELPMAPVVPVAVQKGNVLEIVPTGEVQDASLMPVAAEEPLEDESKPKRKRVNFVDNVLPNYESESEDRAVVSIAVERALCQHQERRSRAAARLQQIRDELLALPPPPPPLTPKPANLEKPVLVQKKPKFRYFHFDPIKGAIVKTHSRVLRPNIRPPFDPKHFAMLIKTGRLPPFPPAFMRHRPPNIPPHVDPATKAAMFKEFFSKHPPPPLPMPTTMPDGMPYYLSGPPPMPAGVSLSPVPQPIPVLGTHGFQGYAHPSPVPVPVPVPPVAMPPLAASVPAPTASTPPPALIAPFFTPPPLPELLPILPDLPTTFTVKSVPTITEIMPVDILQQLGPLPKTLDVDDGGGMASPELASNDLKEIDADAELEGGADAVEQQPGVEEVNTQLLLETQ